MITERREFTYAESPSPFPEGWYFVATREAVLKAKLIQKTWMGENVIIWSDESVSASVSPKPCARTWAPT